MLYKTCTVANVDNIYCMLFISSVIHLIKNGNSFRGYSALCQTPEVHIQDQNFLKETSNLELLVHVIMHVILNTYKVGLDWRAIQERANGLPRQQTIADYGNRTFFPIMFTSMITRQTLSVRKCKTFLVSCYTYLIRFLFQNGESSMTFDRIWDQFAKVHVFVLFPKYTIIGVLSASDLINGFVSCVTFADICD